MLRVEKSSRPARHGDLPLDQAVQKIILSASCDIPFNELTFSQSSVRRIKAGVSVEELAESIARRALLQSLNVRPILDGAGQETGRFEVPPVADGSGRWNC